MNQYDPDEHDPGQSLTIIAAQISADFNSVAARATPPAKQYRHNYSAGAAIIARIRGGPYSAESLRKSSIERIYVGREARLADDDLIALGEALREADRRTLHNGPRARRREGRGAEREIIGVHPPAE